MFLTFIVPIYNAENTLERCLNSIKEQGNPDWNCLCIDDGSTDASQSIINRFMETDKRFQIFVQENHGLALTRNRGIEKADGDYLSFVDADDTIPADAVEQFWKACKTKPDMAIANIARQDGKNTTNVYAHLGQEAFSWALILELFCFQYSVAKAYRSSFVKERNIRFLNQRIYEDEYFTTQALLKAQSIVPINSVLYNYLYNETSLTNAPGKSHDKKKCRLRSALVKQESSDLAMQKGIFWKQALDISCLESVQEVFASLSRSPEIKKELLRDAQALGSSLGPLPWRGDARLIGHCLMAAALRRKSLFLLDLGRMWNKRFPLFRK